MCRCSGGYRPAHQVALAKRTPARSLISVNMAMMRPIRPLASMSAANDAPYSESSPRAMKSLGSVDNVEACFSQRGPSPTANAVIWSPDDINPSRKKKKKIREKRR